jgi:hypothetical protein
MFYHDPNLLLSVVNTKLRDKYKSLEDLCEYEDMDKDKIIEVLEKEGYEYNKERNAFVYKG